MNGIEKRVIAVRPLEISGHTHVGAVKLEDGTVEDAAEVITAINEHEAHYTMIPPEGAPAYRAWKETGLPLLLQTRPCPDCLEEVLLA